MIFGWVLRQQGPARRYRLQPFRSFLWHPLMDWRNREQRRRKVHEPGNAHELTFTCYRRFQFLKAERTCSWLADAIIEARAQHNFDLWAYVFMPEHVHLLINPRGADYQ